MANPQHLGGWLAPRYGAPSAVARLSSLIVTSGPEDSRDVRVDPDINVCQFLVDRAVAIRGAEAVENYRESGGSGNLSFG